VCARARARARACKTGQIYTIIIDLKKSNRGKK